MECQTRRIETPLGPVLAGAVDGGVCLLEFAGNGREEAQQSFVCRALKVDARPGDHPLLERLQMELAEYFDGERRTFSVPLALTGTAFQRAVWNALQTIPYGKTNTYAQIATCLGVPRAARAVGAANRCNPVAILIPCHRLVGSDGALTGYGGGLWRKRRLLDLERTIKTAG